jgi:hypothetical protein
MATENQLSDLYLRIIQTADLDEIQAFEKSKLSQSQMDPMEQELFAWTACWRTESLNHYLPMGWSFLARDRQKTSQWSSEGELVGYFIAQPLLFFDGQTQSLWVEHLSYLNHQAKGDLCELAYRLSREKHFQRVYLPDHQDLRDAVQSFKPEPWDPPALYLKTTKAK